MKITIADRVMVIITVCHTSHNLLKVAADEFVSVLLQSPIKMVEDDITEQGRNHPALQRTLPRWLDSPVFYHTGLKEFLDQTQNVPIGHLPLYHSEHQTLVDGVVKALDISIHDQPIALTMALKQLFHRRMAAAVLPEPMGAVVEGALEDRVDQTPDHLLCDPTAHSWDPQRSKLTGSILARLFTSLSETSAQTVAESGGILS